MSWIIYLSIIGIILICLELFLPGMVAGTIGGICLVIAVVLTYTHYGITSGTVALAALLVTSVVATMIWLTIFPKTPSGRSLTTSYDLSDSKTAESLVHLIGEKGKALSALRPSGTAIINEERMDVIAESGWIPKDTEIEVVRAEGNRLFVRRIESSINLAFAKPSHKA